ncbi:IclR family transcriptional regulator [Azorhizobium oxalatiphilum]|nr:IclR family transcriptional regulator [Azorhizobium oxalatiphilum]
MPKKPATAPAPDAVPDAAGDAGADKRRSSLFVGSTEKAFQVLHAFDGPHRFMTLADIARASGLDRSAAQRLVHTLETLGYIKRVPDTRNYALTSKVLQFSYSYLRANELVDKALPYLLDVSRRLGETANLQELDGPDIVFIARIPGQHMAHIDIVVGSRLPTFFTASGTAMLSRMSEAEQREILAHTNLTPLTPFTETDPEALMARVRQASERGYAITVNQAVMGDISVGAAITDEQGKPVAAITISVPTSRWTPERAEAELAHNVQVAATSISKQRAVRLSS